MAPIYSLTLIVKTDANPGWYIVGQADEETIIPRRISPAAAAEIARQFEDAMPVAQEGAIGGIHPFELVALGTVAAKEEIAKNLGAAEDIATTVPKLRQALNELTEE